MLTNTDGIQFEKVAALRPDLILGIYSGLTQQDYATLSKIAPTVAQPKDQVDYGVSWQELTRTVGRVGRPQGPGRTSSSTDVEALIRRGDARSNPAFAGATGLMATTYEGYWVYGPQDPRGRLLTDLGFTLPAGLAEVTGKEFGANLSKERTDLLDTDVLIWLVDSYDTDKAKVQADPLYAKLKVKTEARDVYLENEELLGARDVVHHAAQPAVPAREAGAAARGRGRRQPGDRRQPGRAGAVGVLTTAVHAAGRGPRKGCVSR